MTAVASAARGGADDVATRALRGSAVGLVNVGLGIGTTVATVPLVLRSWDEGTYAVWLAVFAVYSLLQTVDTGHAGYLGNEFLRLAHASPAGLRRAYASGLRVALVLGAAQLLAAAAVLAAGLVPRVLGVPLGGRSAAEAGLALVALAVGWWASGSFGGIIAGLYYPHGEFVRAQWWAIANRLMMFGALVIPAIAGYGVLGAAVATGAANVAFTAAYLADARRRFPVARAWRLDADWGEAVRNVRRSLAVTANNACVQVGTSGLSLAVAALLGAGALPAFTTVRTLTNTAAAVSTVVVSPIVPDMVRYRVRGEWSKLRASFEASWLGVGVVVQLGLVATIPVAEPLYRGWTHGRIPFDPRLYAVLGWGVGVAALASPALRYLQAMNRLSAQTWCSVAYLAALAAGVALAAPALGLWGVGVALAVAELARGAGAFREVARELGPGEAALLARSVAAAALPACLSGAALALGVYFPRHRVLLAAVGVVALVPTFVLQWAALEPALRERVRRLLPARGHFSLVR